MADLQWDRAFALEQAGDDEELLAELLDLLRSSGQDDLERIKAAMTGGDPMAMGDAAHSIKGAAASLGVETLRSLAHDLEKAGRNGDLVGAARLLPDLEAMLDRLAAIS